MRAGGREASARFFVWGDVRFFGVVTFVFSETPRHHALFDGEGVQVDAVILGRLAELLAGHGVDVGKVEDSRGKAAHHGGAVYSLPVQKQILVTDGTRMMANHLPTQKEPAPEDRSLQPLDCSLALSVRTG